MITDQNGYLVNKSNTYSHSSPVDLQSVISMEILESDAPYMEACNHEVRIKAFQNCLSVGIAYEYDY